MKFPTTTARTRPNNFGFRGWVYAGRYGIERYLYTLQRITGLGVLIYLPLHIIVTGQKLDEASWNATMDFVYRLGPYGEFLVFVGAVFHGLNGIRLLFTEFGYMLAKPARPVYPFTNAAVLYHGLYGLRSIIFEVTAIGAAAQRAFNIIFIISGLGFFAYGAYAIIAGFLG